MEKTCTTCGVPQDLDQFHKQRRGLYGRRATCRRCSTARHKAYIASHPDRNSVYGRAAYRKNPELVKARNQSYRRTPKGWAVNAWARINQRTVNGAKPNWKNRAHRYYLEHGVRLEISKEDFYAWVVENWAQAEAVWAAGLKPSIDRIDSTGHYAIGNLRIISTDLNSTRGGGLAAMHRLQKKDTPPLPG